MAKFCRHCGNAVTEKAKFCKNCGQPIGEIRKQPDLQTDRVSVLRSCDHLSSGASEMNFSGSVSFCRFCGNSVRQGDRFCGNCGLSLYNTDKSGTLNTAAKDPGQKQVYTSGKKEITRAQETSAAGAPSTTKIKSKKDKEPAAKTRSRKTSSGFSQGSMIPNVQSLAAAATSGEIDFGVIGLPDLGVVTEQVTKALHPITGIFQSIGSFIGGIFSIFKKPGALIGTLALAALYYHLALNRGSDSPIIKWLSLLTYAEGGFDREGILGIIGGTLGKGTTAAALLSLFNGGLVNLFRVIGAFFKGHGGKRGIISFLFGILLCGAAYYVFVGSEPSEGAFAAGIAGAVLSLEALGSGSGKLYTLVQSLTSRATDGIRTAVQGRCDSLLRGLTLGFSIASIVSVIL